MSRSQWIRVSRSEPCPICEKPDYCTRSADGEVVHCMRIESDKPIEKGGWLHRLTDPLPRKQPPPPVKRKPDWTPECKRLYEHRLAKDKRFQVARQLGVRVSALDDLRVGVGWDWNGKEYSSWPSRDATGRCIGYVRRYDDGSKKTNRGGSTGLFYTANWCRYDGPILIVEGGSDVAACESNKLCAIGRPSNVYGSRWIRPMLRRANGKRVIVVGERDEKPEKRGTVSQCPPDCQGCAYCWPGLYGMQKVARELRCESIMISFPHKDMRELLADDQSYKLLLAKFAAHLREDRKVEL